MRNEIIRIETRPSLECFNCLVDLTGYITVIFFGDVKTLTFAHTVAQFVSFIYPFLRGLKLILIHVIDRDASVCHRKVLIELNGALVKN